MTAPSDAVTLLRMRWWLLVLVACKVSFPPQTTLYVNSYTIQKPVTASPGSRIELRTVWQDSCTRRSTPWIAGSYEGDHGSESYACNSVRYRVHVRCVEACKIRTSAGETADAADWGPTRDDANFVVEPLAETVQLEVTFEHDRERRTVRTVPVRIATPTDVVVECQHDTSGWGPCDALGPRTNKSVRVRELSGILLGDVWIGGAAAAMGYAPITRFVPTGPDHALVPGDYPITVEVGHGPNAIRREVVLHVR